LGVLSYLLEFYRGAALPTNTPGIPCIFDPQGRAGICGDWLLGSSLESAALSGMALANHVSIASVLFLFLFYFTY
jgi:predicted NAD/FAD-dependent oxidoreductase